MDKEKLVQLTKMVRCTVLVLMVILTWESAANALPSAEDLVNVIGLMRPGDSALPFISVLNRDDSLSYDFTTTNDFNIHRWTGGGTSTIICEHNDTRNIVCVNYAVYTGDKTKATKLQNEVIQYTEKNLKQSSTFIMGKPGFRFSTGFPHVFFVETGGNFISLTQSLDDERLISAIASIPKNDLRF